MATRNRQEKTPAAALDMAIVGAGFAGMYMLYQARKMGLRARVFERGNGVGGTWFWNRYPGARCDVESMQYSYQFSDELQQEWDWSERYASQPEILAYANHVADRFDLRTDIQFDSRVLATTFDENSGRWVLQVEDVETNGTETFEATYCVMATGCLSAANMPDIPGLNSFTGDVYHTGSWPHEGVDFTGKRVAIIGTGSSAIQSIPIIAEQADHLYVFQRTPNFSVPAQNSPLDPDIRDEVKATYQALRDEANRRRAAILFPEPTQSALEVSPAQRRAQYEKSWELGGLGFMGAFTDLMLDREANKTAAEFVREKIAEIVKDPKTADALAPDSVIGCKRLCADTGYFETFNRSNVSLVDIHEDGIEAIELTGIRAGSVLTQVDVIVFATGFDAMTGALNRIQITSRDGKTLKSKWAEGPRTYLGVSTAGFPNLFIITGPGSPSVLANMIPAIEQNVNWIAGCIAYMRKNKVEVIEAEEAAENTWVEHVNDVASFTLYPYCNSWYLGANIPGKPRVFMPYLGFDTYSKKCAEVAMHGYQGFRMSLVKEAV